MVIIMFFLHGALHISLSWIAIAGAMLLIILAGIQDVDEVLAKVEWGKSFSTTNFVHTNTFLPFSLLV